MQFVIIHTYNHWFDDLSPAEQEAININGKFDSRYEVGDFIEWRENNRFFDSNGDLVGGVRLDMFCVLEITDVTETQAEEYLSTWTRKFSVVQNSKNPAKGEYIETITLDDVSIAGTEKFNPKDTFLEMKVADPLIATFSKISQTDNSIQVKMVVNKNGNKTQLEEQFLKTPEDFIPELNKIVKKSKYKLNIAGLPIAMRNSLLNDKFFRTTMAEISPYIINKAGKA